MEQNTVRKARFCTPDSFTYEFYLDGTIDTANLYTEWFDDIRKASDVDTIIIHINSYGGDLDTTVQMMRALQETSATVVCSIEGACMSAATMIFLVADTYEVSPHSTFMIHNFSAGYAGKGGSIYSQAHYQKEWFAKLVKETYIGFLSEDEINSILDDKDIWLQMNEVVSRCKKLIESREEQP